jgi:hypothetical protein
MRVGGRRLLSPLFLLAVSTLLLGGCASNDIHPHPTNTAAATTATIAPIPTPNQTPLSLRDAWGNIGIRKLPLAINGGQQFIFENAVTPNGQWLVGVSQPADFVKNTSQPSYLVLYGVATGQLVTVRQLLHQQSQVIGASADDRWVVWSEAADQPNFFDWTLFAYDRQTHVVRQIAQAVRGENGPVHGPVPYPVVDHGRLLWGQAIGEVGSDTLQNAVVMMEDLNTGEKTTLATKAGSPNVNWPWASWDQQTTESDGNVVLHNLASGQQVTLAAKPATVAIAGTSIAYDDQYSIHLIDDFTHAPINPQLITGATTGDYAEFTSLNDRLIAWISTSSSLVYDRVEHRLVELPPSSGVTPGVIRRVVGRLLVWIDENSLYVIDTRTLPTTPPS